MEEIEKRFDLLPAGEIQKTRQELASDMERRVASRETRRVSPRDLPLFHKLRTPLRAATTPLVNGVRIAGPFKHPGTEVRLRSSYSLTGRDSDTRLGRPRRCRRQ